ncbi:MAG: hypothetical protein ACJAYK_002818 [Crocinitomicaceae bacterium]|jgi:hypothetical protein
MTLTLSALFGQDVCTVCLTVFKAVCSLFEALCSTTMTFNFVRHANKISFAFVYLTAVGDYTFKPKKRISWA